MLTSLVFSFINSFLRGITPSSFIRRRYSLEESFIIIKYISSNSLSRVVFSIIGSSIGGGIRRSSSISFTLGKVYSKAFLIANRVIAYINRIIVRLLTKYRSLILDRLYALYNIVINYYSGVDLYSLALVV